MTDSTTLKQPLSLDERRVSTRRFSSPVPVLLMIDEMEALTAGGTERQLLQMIRLFQGSEFVPELAILRGTEWLTPEFAACPLYRMNVPRLSSVRALRELKGFVSYIRERRFSILQTFFVEANLIGPVLARWTGIPVVIGSRRNMNHWMKPKFALAQRISNLFVDRLQANSLAVKEMLTARERAASRKIDVFYNSLDVEQFAKNDADRARIRTMIGVTDSDIVITNVSALRHPKGVDNFVRAAKEIGTRYPQAVFVLVGDGPLRKELTELASAGDAPARVYFAGAQEEVAPWLSASDIGVLCSDAEGFSNSLLEYMAAGLPIVATCVGGNAEAIEGAGLLIPPGRIDELGRAVSQLIDDPHRRADLGAAAFARARSTYSLPVAREALLSYYRKLLSACGYPVVRTQ